MINPVKIAVDAMGGENSPSKVIKGIEIHSLNSSNIFYNIFGNQNLIIPSITFFGEFSPPIASTAILIFSDIKNYSLGSKTCLPL